MIVIWNRSLLRRQCARNVGISKVKMMPTIKLNKSGNLRGMSPGSRKTQFKPEYVVNRKPKESDTPQLKAQRQQKTKSKAKKSSQVPYTKTTEGLTPEEKVQKLIDEVMSIDGQSIKKSLMGMAQTLGASPEDIERIRNASENALEREYRNNRLSFEMYWEYPLEVGDDRGDELDDILKAVGI